MSKSTKRINLIFRAVIIAAFVLATAMVFIGSSVIINTSESAQAAGDALSKLSAADMSTVIRLSKIIIPLLSLAVALSIFAYQCPGLIRSIIRTVTIILAGVVSGMSSAMFKNAAIASKVLEGTASEAEITKIQPMMDQLVELGLTDSANGNFFAIGMAAAIALTVILAVLFITSIVSIVKTVKMV